jgi:tetratricopeptide (TPR) repeat protein
MARRRAGHAPDDTRAVETLARNLSALAATADPAERIAGYAEAVQTWDLVTRLRPGASALGGLATALDRLSDNQRRAGRADADRTADRAIAVRERLLADHPGETDVEASLAAAYVSRGERYRDHRRDDEAAAADFRRAAPLWESLIRRSPDNREFVSRMAINEMCLAQLDLRRRKVDDARAGFLRALDRLDKLVITDDVSVNRGVCCVNLGQLAIMDRKPTDARPWFDRAEQILKPLANHSNWKAFVGSALADCARGREKIGGRSRSQ